MLAASSAVMQAHPGHDGHELTWDFRHLAAYPFATIGCFVVIAAVAWFAAGMVRSRTTTLVARASRDPR
jgi:hypothetical protein